MRTLIGAAIAAALLTTPTLANEPYGTWETKKDASGAYLHVKVEPCPDDEKLLCANVVKTFETPHTEIVGRKIFWDLETEDGQNWSGGQVWDAATDKTYDAKVILGKTRLRVEGCVSLFCEGQNWTRVE